MAHKLDIGQAAYAKIENNTTKITIDRLFAIAKILETEVINLMDVKGQTIFNQNHNDMANAFGKIEHYNQENKEITQKLIASYELRLKEKDEMIAILQSQVQ